MKTKCGSLTRAFSLTEMLVVIAVILFLARLLMPGLDKAKEIALDIRCANNLHQLGIAFATYLNDHNGVYPSPAWGGYTGPSEYVRRPGGRSLNPLYCAPRTNPDPARWSAMGNYVNASDRPCLQTIWRCPLDYNANPTVSYSMNWHFIENSEWMKRTEIKYPAGFYMLVEQTPNGTDMGQCGTGDRPPAPPYHKGGTMGYVLFVDGHVKGVKAGWTGSGWDTTTAGTMAYDFANKYGCEPRGFNQPATVNY